MLEELTAFDPKAEEEKVEEAISDMDSLGLEVCIQSVFFVSMSCLCVISLDFVQSK